MTLITHEWDRADHEARKRLLIELPTITRRLYRRKHFAGLEANALQVLIAVDLVPQRTVGDLVKELALAQSTVSTALARLQERELITTAADPDDARRQLQQTTPQGTELVNQFLDELNDRLTEA